MAQEAGVQSKVELYQIHKKKCYLMLSYLAFSIISYGSRVKWSNPGKGVAPSLIPRCNSYCKRSLRVTFDYDGLNCIGIFETNWLYASKNCLERIVSYLKPYNCLQVNDYHLFGIITLNTIIVYELLSYLWTRPEKVLAKWPWAKIEGLFP